MSAAELKPAAGDAGNSGKYQSHYASASAIEARRRGYADARMHFSSASEELRRRGESEIARSGHDWELRLRQQHNEQLIRIRQDEERKIADEAIRHSQRIASMDREHQASLEQGKEDATIAELVRQRNEAAEEYRHVRARLRGRPLNTHGLEKWYVYLPILAGLAIAEVPINKLAFDLFFETQSIWSIAIAGGLGVLLIFFCHILGMNFRRMRTKSRIELGAKLVFVTTLFSLCTVIVFVISKFREGLKEIMAQEGSSSVSQMFETGNVSAEKIFDVLFTLKLSPLGAGLFLLNFAILIAGIVLAFYRHDPDPNYEHVKKRHDRLSRRVADYVERLNKARQASSDVHHRERTSVDEEHALGVKAVADEFARLQAEEVRRWQAAHKSHSVEVRQCIQAYAEGYNQGWRENWSTHAEIKHDGYQLRSNRSS